MDLSIVVPLLNEEESLPELTSALEKVMQENHFSYEIIFVDDGSTDNSWNVIQNLAGKNSNVRAIQFFRNYGKSAGLNAGFRKAQGEIIITMDADLQDRPEEIPELVRMIRNGNDMVCGWKKKRFDPFSKTLPSKLFNWATRVMSGIPLHDFNCGLKAYRKDVVKNIEVYGEMHRYIPVLAKWSGFKKITEKPVRHAPRKYGKTKFGASRFINGFLDYLSVGFILRYMKKPMHFFGMLGTFCFLAGTILGGWLSYEKIFMSKPLANRPILFLVVLLVILGVQFFITGLLGEMVSRSATEKAGYKISETLGIKSGE